MIVVFCVGHKSAFNLQSNKAETILFFLYAFETIKGTGVG